ncbi:type I secretion C-terminal target domain-containing protein, partial [Iodobacter sp. HSC-16F04]
DDNVVEGNNLVFNVSLSTATTKAETYAFNLGGGSASAADYGTATFSNGVTYNATTGLITVPAGVTNFAVTLPTVDDALVEITPETVPLTIGGVSATGGILDNDSPAITGIEVGNPGVADDNVVEGNNLVFNVSLSTATTKAETYAFNLGGGSASAADYGTATFSNGVTYNATTGLITVPAGVTNFAVTLPTVDDALVEITPETVPLTIGGVSATGGILDNDSPAITGIEVGNPGVADDNVVEGNNLVFNVSLSTATTKPETYAFNLGGGSASAADYGTATFSNGVTYNATTGLITVPAGVTNFAVTLPTVDDALVEITPETVPLTIGGVSATGGILDNDFAPDTNNVSASGVEDQALPIAITLSGTDADGTVAGFRILNLPGNGTLYRDAAMTQLVVAGSDLTAASNSLTLYFKPAHDWNGSTNFNYAAKDNTGLIDATPGTATINVAGVNDAPVIANASATVSEEGLAGGIIDNTGSPTDTTNSTVSSGTIVISDPDSTTLTTTLLAPADVLSSGGQALVWSGSGTQDLVAKVGSTTIAAIHIDNAGHYTVTLSGPIDHPVNSVEDVKSFNVGVQVSDGSLSSTGTLTVNVEDDAPVGQSKTADVQIPNVDSNLILTIDVSGSMADPSGIPGKTRLQVAKEAITKLIDDYDVLGDVKVMLVTFSTSAATQQSGGQTWMSVDEAKTILANLTANGGTNYDAAVGQVMTHYDEAGKIAGGQNIAYFFSDGAPNPGLGLDAGETLTWTNFLNAKDINSLALGLGTGVTATNLNPLAYNGTGSGSEANAIIVTDLAQLPPILRDTIVVPDSGDLTGGVISGASSGFGADGGHMNDITVDGVKYTFDVAHNSVVTSAAAGTYTFDAITHQLKVNTALGGQFAIDMDDGKYTYTPPVIKTSGSSENIGFTLIDNDGDLDTSNSHLTINIVPPAQGNTMQLSASTTAIADSARGLHGEFFGYNNDPDKSAGVTYNVQNQDNTVGNLDNISDITSVINGRQGSNIVGTQTEASAAASDATFIADAIKYGVTPAVTGNLGTNNAVTAGSAITSGNLYNFLGANNAGADTAGLAATSTFGNTTDSIMRMVGGAYFAAGTYDIRVYADDGFRIAVDGQSVFEYNANQPPTTRVQTGVAISEGMHNLEVLYWEQGGNAALKIEFKPSGSADSAYVTLGIDDMALFHGAQAPVLSELQDIIEDPGNNGHYLVRSGQEVTGTNLSDTITGSAGRDIIHGGAGNDVINAGAGADRLDGGAGSDTLTGGLGADTFHWALADKGAVGAPVIDKITDFSVASYNAGGDRLDLKDLLQGENHNVNTGNLTQYLHFEKSGTDTIVHVSSSGAYTGPFNSSADDQRVILSGVDLTSNGSLADAAIIQDLLNKGKLITD